MLSFENFIRNVKIGFSLYNEKINWLVFTFIAVFTIGSWLDLNGNFFVAFNNSSSPFLVLIIKIIIIRNVV